MTSAHVLAVLMKAGNDFHPDQLSSFHHQVIVDSLQGSLATGSDATKLHAEAVQARASILGPGQPDIFLSMTWQGKIIGAEQ
jgi:hypothetical protein